MAAILDLLSLARSGGYDGDGALATASATTAASASAAAAAAFAAPPSLSLWQSFEDPFHGDWPFWQTSMPA